MRSEQPSTNGAAATAAAPPVLQMTGIEKRFGPVVALDGVDFDVRAGEVHALLGENGAGKTTLMNVACGICRSEGGRIAVRGADVVLRTPKEAFRHGLGIVHQNYRLVRNLTVAENLHLGWEDTPPLLSERGLERRARELSEQLGLRIEPSAYVWQLSVGELQRVAILRTLIRGARTLVLDEPTAALTPQEADHLFEIVRAMVADGRSVVFISHKLTEVLTVADRVSVLRGGRRVAVLPAAECTTGSLAQLMVGREISPPERRPSRAGDVVAALEGVEADDDRALPALRGVDLRIRAGEIVGVAGVAGNGQRELAEVLTGARRSTAGEVVVGGRRLTNAGPRAFIAAGVGHIPEDIQTGLALRAPIELSATMKQVGVAPIRRGWRIDRRAIRACAEGLMRAASLERVNTGRRAATMSGGQAQRLIVQRELAASSQLLVAAHPTRGLDVSATEVVHRGLLAARDRRVGVVLISEDLDEVLELSDRVAVMYEGRILAEFAREDVDRERVGLLMGGVTAEPAS